MAQEVLSRYQSETMDVQYDEEEEKRQVRAKPIAWDAYKGTYIDQKEIDKIQAFDKKQADKLQLFEENGVVYAKVFMIFLCKLTKDEDVRYVLTLLDDFLVEAQKTKNFHHYLNFFFNLHKSWKDPSVPPSPYGPIFSLLSRRLDDPYILSLASRILTTLILHHSHVPHEIVENAFVWFVDEILKSPQTDKFYERKISIALISLRALFSVNNYRKLFISDAVPGGLEVLMQFIKYEERREEISLTTKSKKKQTAPEEKEVTKKASNFQIIYEAVYCLWCLSFNDEVKEKLTEPKLIYNLCYIVKRCTNKVKVVRVSLATLSNLVGVGKNNEYMYSYGLLQSLGLLKQKRWGDEELEHDIKEIEVSLERDVDDLTSWDRYKNEVLALSLDWTPAHKSNKFWQENSLKFEEDNYLVLTTLRTILNESKNPQVLAIACWDIGEFVRVHPQGKRICDKLQLKAPIMKLLTLAETDSQQSEETQQVTKEALTALQKLMITNWEYLQN